MTRTLIEQGPLASKNGVTRDDIAEFLDDNLRQGRSISKNTGGTASSLALRQKIGSTANFSLTVLLTGSNSVVLEGPGGGNVSVQSGGCEESGLCNHPG
jgi:hypothetical protein